MHTWVAAYHSTIHCMDSNDRACVPPKHYPVVQVLLHSPGVDCCGGHNAILAAGAALEDGQQGLLADALACHKAVLGEVPDV